MSFLGRAKKMWQGLGPPEPPRPQYYNVACPEGHVLRGTRTEGYQAIRCPECGEGIFVLPRSPLPEPPAPAGERARSRPTYAPAEEILDDAPLELTDPPAQGEADAEIEWLDPEPAPARPELRRPAETISPEELGYAPEPSPRPKTKPGRPAIGPARPARTDRRRRPTPARPAVAEAAEDHGPTISIADRPGLVERIRRRPLPPLIAAVMLIVLATVGLKFWRERRAHLPHVAETSRVEGLEAMDRGEFDLAKARLATAASAFEELGDEKAGQVRDYANQAAILADLVGRSLEELIDEAAYRSEEWPDRFKTLYRGRSVVIDAPIRPREDGGPGFEVEYHIVGEGKSPKIGRIDASGLKLFEGAQYKVGDRVLFGARLASVALGERGRWVVGLEPDSGVFMTQARALGAIPGWDEATGDNPAAVALLTVLFLGDEAISREVDPAELTRHPEWIGREIVVDDRIRLFLTHPGRGFDEIALKRTDVPFRLPPELRYRAAPDERVARIRGVLKRSGNGELVVDVSTIELLPEDSLRLEAGVKVLSPRDAEGRARWASWAARRGAEFDDPYLKKRASELETEALRIEAERTVADPPALWLALAKRARERELEVEARALAHRGFRDRLAQSRGVADFEKLAEAISAFFLEADQPAAADLTEWTDAYRNRPADAYRMATPAARRALDRNLLADAIQRKWELLAEADPKGAAAMAESARRQLPDRPEVARRLEERGVRALEADPAHLGRDEVEALAGHLRAAGKAEDADELLRSWLAAQRARLPRQSVDDRIKLAELYVAMLDDRATAETLLFEARGLDPDSRELSNTFRRLGYRRNGDEWVAPDRAGQVVAAQDDGNRGGDDLILGATRKQIRDRLGIPDRIARCITQGQVVEQWVYTSPKRTQYLNFVRSTGLPEAIVQRHGVLP